MATWTRREALRLAAATGLGSLVIGAGRAVGAPKTIARSPAYPDGVLAKGPVGYWRLGEATGPTVVDETGNGHDGRIFGSPTLGTPGAINDDPDTAIQFNGFDTRDYVEIPDSEDFSQPTSTQGLTVEVWMRPDFLTFRTEGAGYVHWLGKGMPGQGEWGLRFYPSTFPNRPNRVSAYIWNADTITFPEGAGAYFQESSDHPLVVGHWVHVVACYEPGDKDSVPPAGVHIYKNGVHRQGPPSSGTLYRNFQIVPQHGTAPLRFGTRDRNSFFAGALDEIAIYPRVLTPDEILENYYNGILPY
jgi:hypothetical protein